MLVPKYNLFNPQLLQKVKEEEAQVMVGFCSKQSLEMHAAFPH